MRSKHREVTVLLALITSAYLWDVLSINKDAAFLHIIKTEKQADDGAFARPRLSNLGRGGLNLYCIIPYFSALLRLLLSHKTYQCYCLTRYHSEGDILENFFPVDIQNADWDHTMNCWIDFSYIFTWTYPAVYLKPTFWKSTLPSVQSRSTAFISSFTCRTEDHKRVNEEWAEGIQTVHRPKSKDRYLSKHN